ncbi:hypothetical protein IGX37_01265 [Staphylococcus aureus]|nr:MULTISPECIES: hypothetical protein [Staphylococcus]HDH6438633.1 hypothetical protein [Staphylococcus aureus MRSA-Lux-28]AXS25567.1 hypothetical protein D1G35_14440 [Staphylococcus aureus]AXS28309.1 hypothetical protein D1O27_14225 [Staphylococcus aureus]KAC51861.1 hypothetical protein W527_02359 [Staphylococcus aureus VET0243R]KAE20793.1 hypothetical protein W599_02344 [Staphylococcus aureus VET0341R]
MENEKTRNKKPYIYGFLLLIIILIALIIVFVVRKTDALGQINKFEDAVESNDSKKVSEILSGSERTMSDKESKAFIKYMVLLQSKKI